MKYYFFFFLIISATCLSQENELLNIIRSNNDPLYKQHKLDSLSKLYENTFDDQRLADFYHDLGAKWYYPQWRKSENGETLTLAIETTKKALLLKKNIDSISDKSIKKTLYNLAFFNSRNEDVFEAIRLYSEIVENYPNDYKTISAYFALGINYNETGDFHKALASFKKIIFLSEKEKGLVKINKLIEAYIGIANAYCLMGYEEYEKEIEIYIEKADTLIQQNLSTKNSFDFKIQQINQIRANRLLKLGKFDEAVSYYKKLISGLSDPKDLSRVFNSLGLAQLGIQEFDSATINLLKSIQLNPVYASPYNNMGELYLAKKDFSRAFENFEKAIHYTISKNMEFSINENLTIEDLQVSPDKISLLNHIITKANGFMKYFEYDANKKNLQDALHTFFLADQLVDVIRFESTEYQSKLFWRKTGASLYMKAVQVCYLLNKVEDAFYFMEKNKAVLLLEDITNEDAKEIAKVPTAIAKREFQLKKEILLSENALQTGDILEENGKEALRNTIEKQKRTYKRFVDSLTRVFPEYAKFKRNIKILSHTDFRKKFISNNDVVLHYIVNEDEGYGLLTSLEESLLFSVDEIDRLHQNIKELQKDLSKGIRDPDVFLNTSNTVFHQLLPDTLYELVKEKKLTIIPDFTLQQIPFETLVTDQKDLTYLIETVEIKYAYSISHQDRNQQLIRKPTKEYIGLAPVSFNNLKLSPLLHSKEEIIEAEKLYSGDLLANEEATKANFLTKNSDYKIIHLSTHADIGKSGNPWIAFNDTKMFLKEIYTIKNQAEMIVLSGCNTSRGEIKQGEGVMSLARGFFHSGAKSVVSSLWTINEKASKDILIAFYKELSLGETKSTALRRAKLEFIHANRENSLSPNLWGSLILIGDNTSIATTTSYSAYLLAGIGIMFFVIFFIFYQRKNR